MSELRRDKYLQHQLKVRQLSIALAVERHQSILRASRALHLTQPAVTKSISELERVLGADLFSRSNKGVVPTPFGESFLKHAKIVLSELDTAAEELQQLADGEIGEITIGIPATISELLPKAVARLKTNRTDLGVRIIQGTNENLISSLRAGDVDVIISHSIEPWEYHGVNNELLCDDEIAVVVRRDHPLLKAKRAPGIRNLLTYPWILPLPGTSLRASFESTMVDEGLELPASAIEIMSGTVIRDLLLITDMVAVMSRRAVACEPGSESLSVLSLDLESMTCPIYVSTSSSRLTSPATALFIRYLKEVAGELDR